MHWFDWLISSCPFIILIIVSLRTRQYVRGVSDFLAAGRVAGRYVLTIAHGEAAIGLVSVVAMFEVYYKSGFAFSFWNNVNVPVSVTLGLTGYLVYRFRETRAMTLGQFFEIRYSKSFRFFAAFIQSLSGLVNYAVFPAVGARFLVYYCDLPIALNILGWEIPTFALLMFVFLSIATIIVTMGGQITILVTDCVQGILSYPMYVLIVIFILCKFSWHSEMSVALLDRAKGESMLNPFDITRLRDFNLFYVFVGIVASALNWMSKSGMQGYNAAAITPHEQKMAGVLGQWRAGFSMMMVVLLAITAYTFMNHEKYAPQAQQVQNRLSWKALNDVSPNAEYDHVRSPDDQTIANRKADLESSDPGKYLVFNTIYSQMRTPMTLRTILPVGLTGVFCAIMVFLLVSTDTTYMHSWGSIIVQDLVLPLRRRALTPQQQLFWLRSAIVMVAIFAFFFSYFFGQVDYLMMFFVITGAIWLGGIGPCIVGGFYWKRGTTAGAWAALLSGSLLATIGFVAQLNWSEHIYPYLLRHDLLAGITRVIEGISDPFRPYVDWRVTGQKFPINSREIYFIAMIVSLSLYIGISLLTCRQPFNMDRMLHRGKYQIEGRKIERPRLALATVFQKLLGIDSQYTLGDKILAWSVFTYSIGWLFGSWLVILLWNVAFETWPNDRWATWFFIQNVVVTGLIGVVSTFWFTIGGVLDLRRLFLRLRSRKTDVLDDGRVIGHVNASDIELVENLERE